MNKNRQAHTHTQTDIFPSSFTIMLIPHMNEALIPKQMSSNMAQPTYPAQLSHSFLSSQSRWCPDQSGTDSTAHELIWHTQPHTLRSWHNSFCLHNKCTYPNHQLTWHRQPHTLRSWHNSFCLHNKCTYPNHQRTWHRQPHTLHGWHNSLCLHNKMYIPQPSTNMAQTTTYPAQLT